MTNERKKKILKSHWDKNLSVICPGCRRAIRPCDDMSKVEYVRTKRKTDVFFHTDCVDKVWR